MYIVVLGGGITPEGGLPELVELRLRKAVELFQQHPSPIIVSGKYSLLIDEPPAKTEAQLMQEELVRLGVPVGQVLVEDQSQDTVANAYYVKKLIKGKDTNITVVTSEFHSERAEFIFKKVFGPEFQIEAVATPSALSEEIREKVEARQLELMDLTQKFLHDMPDGDDSFLDGRFYSDPFFQRERPEWVKQFVARAT